MFIHERDVSSDFPGPPRPVTAGQTRLNPQQLFEESYIEGGEDSFLTL